MLGYTFLGLGLGNLKMEKYINKFKALEIKQQLGVAAIGFVIALFIVPNTFVYAAGAALSYKLIYRKTWKYSVVSLFSFITFFSAILWIAGDEVESVNQSTSNQVSTVQEQEENGLESISTSTVASASSSEVSTATNTDSVTETENNVVENEPERSSTFDDVAVNTATNNQELSNQSSSNSYRVSGVVDGDTVKLDMNGTIETIRLIGIDTPETVHPSQSVECMGMEASNKAKELLTGQTVRFESDSSQDIRDRYGRLLGYVFLPNSQNYGEVILRLGYANEYTYSTPYKYQANFKAAEQQARTQKVGLWADGVCKGDEEVIEPENTEPAQEPTSSGDKWYVSSHHSSKFYYCEESDGWKGLSETYLETYDSEAALLTKYPNHTLHESCQ